MSKLKMGIIGFGNMGTCLLYTSARFLVLSVKILVLSQGWFATPHEVLQADWQDVWHSPQPPSQFVRFLVLSVIILFIKFSPLIIMLLIYYTFF